MRVWSSLGNEVLRQSALGPRWGRRVLSSSYEQGGWPRGLASAAQGRASDRDAGPLCGAQQVGARSSAAMGEEVGCRDVPRPWS